jgi:hypothetical protein
VQTPVLADNQQHAPTLILFVSWPPLRSLDHYSLCQMVRGEAVSCLYMLFAPEPTRTYDVVRLKLAHSKSAVATVLKILTVLCERMTSSPFMFGLGFISKVKALSTTTFHAYIGQQQ